MKKSDFRTLYFFSGNSLVVQDAVVIAGAPEAATAGGDAQLRYRPDGTAAGGEASDTAGTSGFFRKDFWHSPTRRPKRERSAGKHDGKLLLAGPPR